MYVIQKPGGKWIVDKKIEDARLQNPVYPNPMEEPDSTITQWCTSQCFEAGVVDPDPVGLVEQLIKRHAEKRELSPIFQRAAFRQRFLDARKLAQTPFYVLAQQLTERVNLDEKTILDHLLKIEADVFDNVPPALLVDLERWVMKVLDTLKPTSKDSKVRSAASPDLGILSHLDQQFQQTFKEANQRVALNQDIEAKRRSIEEMVARSVKDALTKIQLSSNGTAAGEE